MTRIKTILSKIFFQSSKNDIEIAVKAIECNHEKGEFQYYLTQGVKYFKCKNCNEVYEDIFFEQLSFENMQLETQLNVLKQKYSECMKNSVM